MRLYLDDDLASALLSRLLTQAGHDVELPAVVNMSGEDDTVHATHAIRENRTLLSGNHDDFEKLHYLVIESVAIIREFLLCAVITIPSEILVREES